MAKKIELSELELRMLELDIKHEFYPMTATKEEAMALNRVIEKADNLMRELNAYDELDNSLMEWFYAKYKAQETTE